MNRVIVSQAAVSNEWVFPTHRFFEWEKKDEPLCRRLKIGHAGPSKPAAFVLQGKTLVIHPDLWAEAKKFIKPVEREPELPLLRMPPFLFSMF